MMKEEKTEHFFNFISEEKIGDNKMEGEAKTLLADREWTEKEKSHNLIISQTWKWRQHSILYAYQEQLY